MPNPLFSSDRAGENRVTSSTLAVFERLDLALVRELLGAASGASADLETVVFENQVVQAGGVPDARISARFTWWFETKTERNAYQAEGHGRTQLRAHSANLEGAGDAWLFVLTPDAVRPPWFDQLDGVAEEVRERVLWVGFRELADAMTSVVQDPSRLVGEQSRFLLSELVALYETDGLLTNDDTVVVAARSAWPEYQQTGAYVCQAGRAFRSGLTHLGFYAEGRIQPLVPRILERHEHVVFSGPEAEQRRAAGQSRVADLVEHLLATSDREEGMAYDVFLLTTADDVDTRVLAAPVVNDTRAASGRPWAWTLSQRYTSLQRLTSGATVTSQL